MKARGYDLLIPMKGRDPGAMLAYLRKITDREKGPMFEALQNIQIDTWNIRVSFNPGIDPEIYEVDGRQVRCLLYF